jgi:hypothetical protein
MLYQGSIHNPVGKLILINLIIYMKKTQFWLAKSSVIFSKYSAKEWNTVRKKRNTVQI